MTSFGMFKYMALYSMIQFCSILILYWRKTNLSDWQYLYIDLIIIDIVALTMSLSPAYKRISEIPPPKALVTGKYYFLTSMTNNYIYYFYNLFPDIRLKSFESKLYNDSL